MIKIKAVSFFRIFTAKSLRYFHYFYNVNINNVNVHMISKKMPNFKVWRIVFTAKILFVFKFSFKATFIHSPTKRYMELLLSRFHVSLIISCVL